MIVPNNTPPAPQKGKFVLPTELSTPINTIKKAIILIYGERKIGKTSLASKMENALFLFFEPGGSGLRVHGSDISDWRTFVDAVDVMSKTSQFDTVVIDTIDIAYEKCFEFVCAREGVKHASEGDFGSIWNAIEVEFKKQMYRLIATKRGIVMLSHAGEKQFESLSGKQYTKIVPTMSKAAMKFAVGIADILGYYGYYGNDRFLTIAGSDAVEGGHRLEESFRTPSGERVHSIPMGSSAEEAYANFEAAFNNMQEDPLNLEGEATGIRERVAKLKSKKR